MKILKLRVLAAVFTATIMAGVAQGQLVTNTIPTSINLPIPDGSPIGLTSSTTLSGISGTISSVTVNLDITGGFNGDLYAYLAGPTGEFVVLLNRVGLTTGSPAGYGDSGFNITLSDGAPDIHYYQSEGPTYLGGQLTGTWAPDGRNIDPQSSPSTFAATAPSTDLSSFDDQTANGLWTLYVADLSSGGQSTAVSWGLSVVTVPEPQTWALAASGVGLLLALKRGRWHRR